MWAVFYLTWFYLYLTYFILDYSTNYTTLIDQWATIWPGRTLTISGQISADDQFRDGDWPKASLGPAHRPALRAALLTRASLI